MMLQIGDDGVVSSVDEENLIYVDKNELEQFIESYQELEKENEQLKQTIKGVYELLTLEVDVFSDKATEHDINAYRELQQLDNKDAYYMATATKKAIKMLKGDVE